MMVQLMHYLAGWSFLKSQLGRSMGFLRNPLSGVEVSHLSVKLLRQLFKFQISRTQRALFLPMTASVNWIFMDFRELPWN